VQDYARAPSLWTKLPVTALRTEAHPKAPRPAVRPLFVLAALVWLAAPLSAQSASEVQVTPETMTLTVGQRQPIFAAAYDRKGNLIASARFAFRSSDTSIARVSPGGTVEGVAAGLAKIEARIQGRRASVAVLITGAPGGQGSDAAGALLTLSPASAVLLPGEPIQLTPQALSDSGAPPELGQVAWKSLKPEIAKVDSTGVVTGVAPGKTIVQATAADGLMATVPIDVEPADIALERGAEVLGPQDAETLHVRVPSQNNREISAGLEWRSADTAVAVVGPAGIVEARGPGRTEIIASGFGQERRIPLRVHRLPQTLVVTPKPLAEAIQTPLRGTRQFSAAALAADSSPIPEAKVTWEVGDTVHARFDTSTGTLSARDTGTTTLTARLRGFEPVVWHIQVVPGLLALDRNRLALKPGEYVTLRASLTADSAASLGPAEGLIWSSDHPEVASVGGGVVRGVAPGHAVVTATAPWGTRASADVYVTADLLVASDRGGTFGLYQVRTGRVDSLLPVLADGKVNVQAVRSPDRTRIAFSSSRGGSFDLFVMDADGANLRRLTHDPGAEGEPAWTPDGARIVYVAAEPGGMPQLMSIGANGSGAVRLTDSEGGHQSPVVSPDGRRIAFVSTRDGRPEVYEMDASGGEARRVTRSSDREVSPRYLPNGELIFVVDKGGSARLMRLPSGATTAMPLLKIDDPVIALDVSREGDRIAYVAGKLASPGKQNAKLSLRIQPLASGSTPLVVPLRPGEQVLSPSF
jgi:uncharacterized protein YjdB